MFLKGDAPGVEWLMAVRPLLCSAERVMSRPRLVEFILVALALIGPRVSYGRPATPAPPLPPPTGKIVAVSTEPQLQSALQKLRSNTTIVLAPGTYVLTSTLYVNGTFTNVGVRGATNNRDDVAIVGPGMTNPDEGNTPFGIWSGGNVQGLTIANLTLNGFYRHPIILNPGTKAPHIYNVHLIDAGEQFIKGNPGKAGVGVSDGILEYSVIEYTTTAKNYYTNGIDIHGGANWIIRHNLFRNIVSPPGELAGPAVLMWNHSRDTVTEGNTFLNCARGISYGLIDRSGNDHTGGIIRNNIFYRSSTQPGDVGIHVAASPRTQVVNNTVFTSGTYPTPIEYRYTQTTGIVIANNLLDGAIGLRDGATATTTTNYEGAGADLFVDAAAGDLHLAATARTVIDAGTPVTTVTDDWDGEGRPRGAAYDIGADEF